MVLWFADTEGAECCKDSSISFEPFCTNSLGCDQSTFTCTPCDTDGGPCCVSLDGGTFETCSDPYQLTCELDDASGFVCVNCGTVGNPCCSDAASGTSFCTDYLSCDESENSCVKAKDLPYSCGTTVSSNGFVADTQAVWNMGAIQEVLGGIQQEPDVFTISYEADADVTMTFSYLYVDGRKSEVWTPNITSKHSKTKLLEQPYYNNSPTYQIVADISSTLRDAEWTVTVSCQGFGRR